MITFAKCLNVFIYLVRLSSFLIDFGVMVVLNKAIVFFQLATEDLKGLGSRYEIIIKRYLTHVH